MLLPIPDDWDGETWFFSCVTWPDSIYWRALFLNSISQYAKGRVWDGRTGSIKGAQAVGREILNRNIAMVDCSQDPAEIRLEYLNWILDCLGLEQVTELPEDCEAINEIFDTCEDCSCDDDEGEGDCMASVTNLKCENGILYMERCCQWVEVCDLSTLLGQTIPPDAETEFTQCTFSGGYALTIYSAIAGLEAYMYSVNAQTAQVMTDMTRQAYAALFLDSWLLFQAAEIYKANISVIHAEIPEELSADVIRCIVYELMANADNFSPEPSNIAVANQFYLQISSLQQVTRDYLAKLIAAINVSYIGSVIGNYRDMLFDCTCNEEPLSPESAYHGVNNWFLSAGIEGSVNASTEEQTWPMVQWCNEVDHDQEIGAYGLAFEIVSFTATGLVSYNNVSFDQQCVSTDTAHPDTSHSSTVFGVGKYIICDAVMYTNLEDDALPYTLVNNDTYSITPGAPTWHNSDVVKLSFRNTVSGVSYLAHVRDFRFVHCGDDI